MIAVRTGAARYWAFGLAMLAAVAQAQDAVSPADRSDVQRVISAQIDAFRHDDGTRALGFATPALREKFGDGPRFLAMVRTAYPAVYRPRSVSFGELSPDGTGLEQRVAIVGPDGEAVTARYDMQHQPDGAWRIAGCILEHSQQITL